MDLFVYGTLMAQDVMRCVCGYARPGERADLHDFRRRRVAGEVYPAIVRWPGDVVHGVLYRGVDDAQAHRLDGFEGELYLREPVEVACGSLRLTAQAYVMAPPFVDRLSDEAWSLAGFVSTRYEDFFTAHPGLRAIADRGADR
jgi:gamma-glutamylcyclotransferase (GGCT)/AIG2-like uncharacterized protein YtfP